MAIDLIAKIQPKNGGFVGMVDESQVIFTDITDGDFSTLTHGYVPKGTNVGNFLKDDGTWASAGAGSQTPWASDIDAAGFSLNKLGGSNLFLGYESGNSNVYGKNSTGIGYQSLNSLAPNYLGTGVITVFADSGTESGTKTTVTSITHGLSDGQEITIADTTNYNGIWIISNKTDDTFDITIPFVSDDATGNWYILFPTNNTAIGYQSGYSITSGTGGNFFGGHRAGYNNLTGYNNVFIGKESGYANISGKVNFFLGNRSGYINTLGHYNVFVGDETGHDNLIGSRNMFLGSYAGYQNIAGDQNSFIGYQAGQTNRFGLENLGIGYEVLYNMNPDGGIIASVSDGTSDAIFNSSGHNLTGGESVRIYGEFCPDEYKQTGLVVFVDSDNFKIDVGGSNIQFAYDTGNFAWTRADQGFNVAIGHQAGHEITTGYGNLFIGYKSGYNETGSNKLYISNSDTATPLIYGEFDNALLRVNGRLQITDTDTYIEKDGSNNLTLTDVVTGTKTLAELVAGGVTDHGALTGLIDDDHTQYALLNGRTGGQTLTGGTAITNVLSLKGTSGNGTLTSPAIKALVGNNGATTALTILNNGNIGIGTEAPTYPLQIYKSTANTFSASIENTHADGWGLEVRTTGTTATKSVFELYSGGVNRFTVRNNGNVGIGIQSPAHTLDVSSGTIRASRYRIGSGGESYAYYNTSAPSLPAGASAAIEVGYGGTPTGAVFATRLNANTSCYFQAWEIAGSSQFAFIGGKVGIGISIPTSLIHGVATLSAATGNEIAYQLNYTTNKATSGDDTGLLLNMTDTASPGTSYVLKANVGGVHKFSVNNSGTIYSAGACAIALNYSTSAGNAIFYAGLGTTVTGASMTFESINNFSQTSGTNSAIKIAPRYEQSSGTASNTDLLINRDETLGVGSGAQFLVDAQVGGVSKFKVSNAGATTQTGQMISSLATGTSPLAVTSTTVNTNLNADMVDGLHSTDIPSIKQNISLTAQVAAIGNTNITGTNTTGLYRVSYYLEDTTADITAGTIMATIGWTDDAGATTTSSVALPLTAIGRTSGIIYVRVLGTGSIQYSTTLVGIIGTSQYGLFITAEKLL